MISSIFSRLTILAFGTLYPAYYSFKTVRAKSVDEYMKWMMYWIVFAIFSATETFTDVFLTWVPFYYELKVLLIFWLLPSMGNGSPIIYRNCLHPFLKKHETRVDHTLVQLKDKGQDMLLHYVTSAVMYMGKAVMDLVHKNMPNGIMGMMVNQGQVAMDRSIQQGGGSANPIVLYEEEELALPTSTKATKRKTTAKTTTKHVVDDMNAGPSTSRNRGRKARQSKPDLDLDINLNES